MKRVISKFRRKKEELEKYTKQRRNVSAQNVRFFNFWGIDDIKNHWFHQFIVAKNINPGKKPINFFSVMGPKYFTKIPIKGKKIFFTGENLQHPAHRRYSDYCLPETDLSLGFDYREEKNYLRLPLWLLYLISPTDSLEDIRTKINKINAPENRNNPDREKFCALVCRYDDYGIRIKILETAERIAPVECAGDFRNNTQDLKDKFGDRKLDYLRQFRFNICPENTDTNGYVTEKLLEAFQSGCIPIYWGGAGNPEPGIFNPKAFLYNDENLEDSLRNLWQNEEAYQNFITEKPFLEGSSEKIWEWMQELEHRIREIT